ncbi:unnamed protein product [Lactuca virosa]|uniref:Uncharacterized protein n=1 Tax=Lactuca virosa TaxID=75947 RepID=A0AAU9MMB2_9ASTR|nr:unnamed protein product [Lactuca virosa]
MVTTNAFPGKYISLELENKQPSYLSDRTTQKLNDERNPHQDFPISFLNCGALLKIRNVSNSRLLDW